MSVDETGTKLERRAFMVVLGAGAGGLMLGLSARPATAGGTPCIIGPYIEIRPDGVIDLYTPGAEMGQGVHDSLPKIIAEEMDADWEQVRVRLSYADMAFTTAAIRRQRNADSDAVMNYYEPLRRVGAGARDMLVRAAAARWGVEAADVTTERSWLIHGSSSRRLSFADVAADAAKLNPPRSPPLKSPAAFTLIGRSTPRKDVPLKVHGSAVFGIDVDLPGMLYAALRHAPRVGGSLAGTDVSGLRRRPGVRAVEIVEGGAVGVVADSFWQAKTALDAFEPPAAPPSGLSSAAMAKQMQAALDKDAEALPFPTFFQGGPLVAPAELEHVEGLIAAAPRRFEAVYEMPYLAHATMEPPCCTALVEPGRCTVWAPHQNATTPQAAVARLLGLEIGAVRFNRTFLGGGFGRKNDLDFVLQCVQLARAAPGRPVKLIWTREEDIRNDGYRPAFMVRTRAGLDAEGLPAAIHSRMSGQTANATAEFRLPGMADATAAGTLISGAYGDFPRRIDFVEVPQPIRTGYWRSVSGSQNGFFSEAVIDELATLAGQDPVEYRAALLTKRPRTLAVLRRAAERSGWGRAQPPGQGRGVALYEGYGSFCAQVAEVAVTGKRVVVSRVFCAFDCGQPIDPAVIKAQLEGGIVFGLTAALAGEITFDGGAVVQGNFDGYRMISLATAPTIEIELIHGDGPIGGVGEAGVPPIAPAVANAIFAATGRRVRKLPISANGYDVL